MIKQVVKKDGKASSINSEVNDVVNNVSGNIDGVVNDFSSADEGFIPKNNEVHDGSTHVNEGFTKDFGLSKRYDNKSKKKVENRKVMLKAKRNPPNKILTSTRMALEKKHYIEEWNYNETIELLSDSQLLKTMLNVGSGYHKLIKEIMVKNNGIPHGLLNFSYKFFVGKEVLDICPPNVLVIDE
ncbi:unnamed protein product [Vicia faba]|uniref:Uncharacterized protein n=1 Tax=Vicia faba TaxID=3906 RepID=A0AAV1B231_VICFA|nr:unnamed protein product [Vicia faba]